MASPKDLPRSGSLLGPKTIKAITKITISSGIPILPNIRHPLTAGLYATPWVEGCQSLHLD
jgi:hypothetical protein